MSLVSGGFGRTVVVIISITSFFDLDVLNDMVVIVVAGFPHFDVLSHLAVIHAAHSADHEEVFATYKPPAVNGKGRGGSVELHLEDE